MFILHIYIIKMHEKNDPQIVNNSSTERNCGEGMRGITVCETKGKFCMVFCILLLFEWLTKNVLVWYLSN